MTVRHRMAALGAAALVGSLAPTAGAAILFQQSYAPDPSGQTAVGLQDLNVGPGFIDIDAPDTRLFVQVSGGTLALVGWDWQEPFGYTFWEELSQGVFVLNGDESSGPGRASIVTLPTISAFTFSPDPSFDECFGALYHYLGGNCALTVFGAFAAIDGVFIDGDTPFTLTISEGTSQPVPEPAAWTFLLAGFAGLGVAIRRRRPRGVRGA